MECEVKCEHFLRLAISGTNKRERAQVYAKSRAKDSKILPTSPTPHTREERAASVSSVSLE